MSETIQIPFSDSDKRELKEFKKAVGTDELLAEATRESGSLNRHVITMPAVEAPTEKTREELEEQLQSGERLSKGKEVTLPKEIVEGAKAVFTASGGNVSEVAALYDLTPEAVMRLASKEEWPVYGGSTKVVESQSRSQLQILQTKLWHRIEKMLDAMEVEKKEKDDIVQYRLHSEYVEPLSARSTAFKTLMDQYMRVSTILEPEIFADDPDGSNSHARRLRDQQLPGGVEGVNREMADFLSEVVVGITDKMKDRDLKGYGEIIDARAE